MIQNFLSRYFNNKSVANSETSFFDKNIPAVKQTKLNLTTCNRQFSNNLANFFLALILRNVLENKTTLLIERTADKSFRSNMNNIHKPNRMMMILHNLTINKNLFAINYILNFASSFSKTKLAKQQTNRH